MKLKENIIYKYAFRKLFSSFLGDFSSMFSVINESNLMNEGFCFSLGYAIQQQRTIFSDSSKEVNGFETVGGKLLRKHLL